MVPELNVYCLSCSSRLLSGPVKKCGLLKVLHEKYKPESSKHRPSSETVAFKKSLQDVAEQNRDMQPHLNKAQVYTLHSLEFMSIFFMLRRLCTKYLNLSFFRRI